MDEIAHREAADGADEDVDPALARQQGFGQARHRRVVGDVTALEHQPLAGGALHRGLEPFALLLDDPRHADDRALGEEAAGDGLAEGAAAAGDEDDALHARYSAAAGASMMLERWISS